MKHTCASVYRNMRRGSILEQPKVIILKITVFYHRLIHIALEGRHIRICFDQVSLTKGQKKVLTFNVDDVRLSINLLKIISPLSLSSIHSDSEFQCFDC